MENPPSQPGESMALAHRRGLLQSLGCQGGGPPYPEGVEGHGRPQVELLAGVPKHPFSSEGLEF